MSVKTIIHDLNKITDPKELEEVLLACRRLLNQTNRQNYDNDVSSSWDTFQANAKRGDIVTVQSKTKPRDVLNEGEELEVFDVSPNTVVLRSKKTGIKSSLSKEELHRFGIAKSLFSATVEVSEKKAKKEDPAPIDPVNSLKITELKPPEESKKPEEPKAEESKPEESKPEEPKVEEPKTPKGKGKKKKDVGE